MIYSSQSLLFWHTGYRLFHGKFIRFMNGKTESDDDRLTKGLEENTLLADAEVDTEMRDAEVDT